MSKFCPFCDDVKDSKINSAEDLQEHLEDNHSDEVIETDESDPIQVPKEKTVTKHKVECDQCDLEESFEDREDAKEKWGKHLDNKDHWADIISKNETTPIQS